MRSLNIILLGLTASAAIAGGAALANQQQNDGVPPAIPSDPYSMPVEVVHAQRFDLDTPAVHQWRADKHQFESGWLLVLKVPSDLVYPRQVREPVLYVGAQTAQRINPGAHESGHLVAIVPGNFLLTDTPIFFGKPGLPEEIDGGQMQREVKRAMDKGVKPITGDKLGPMVAEAIRVRGDYELRQKAVDLVEKFSPQEQEFIRGERVPLVR
ncbi:MAG: hypothetical protein AAF628_30950 [Planctomycetota bacterium]